MSDEEWVKVATGDDAMVADLLLMFKQVKPTAVISSKKALSVEWKVRQRRSRAVTVQTKKQAPPRASPTTPLSWSGATSVSGGGGGGGSGGGDGGEGSGGGFDGSPEEESSRPSLTPHPSKRSDTPRSKVIGTTGETTSTKRTRRKKTLAELKEEEESLQTERRQLKRELTSLRQHLVEARATNEKLKRMKIELQAPPEAENGSKVGTELVISEKLQREMASEDDSGTAILPTIAAESVECSPTNGYYAVEERVSAAKFVLPDLNLPFEEAPNPDIMCGVS